MFHFDFQNYTSAMSKSPEKGSMKVAPLTPLLIFWTWHRFWHRESLNKYMLTDWVLKSPESSLWSLISIIATEENHHFQDLEKHPCTYKVIFKLMNIFRGKIWEMDAYIFLKYIIQKKILLFFRQKSSPSFLKPLIIPVSLHDNTPTHPREKSQEPSDFFPLTSRIIFSYNAAEIPFIPILFNLFPHLIHDSRYWLLPEIYCCKRKLGKSEFIFYKARGVII